MKSNKKMLKELENIKSLWIDMTADSLRGIKHFQGFPMLKNIYVNILKSRKEKLHTRKQFVCLSS